MMKSWKLMFLLILVTAVSAACGPKLVYYKPTEVKPSAAEYAEVFGKQLGEVKNEEYRQYLGVTIDNLVLAIRELETNLMPLYIKMYDNRGNPEEAKKLSAAVRKNNAASFASFLKAKKSFQVLLEKNTLLSNPESRKKADSFARSGIDLFDETLTVLNEFRQLTDLIDGYVKAREEWNMSFLTEENEDRYNRLAASIDQRSRGLNKKGLNMMFQLRDLTKEGLL